MAEEAKAPSTMGTPYLREAVEDWLAYLTVERQLAANTAEAYHRDVSQLLAFLARRLNRLPDMKQLLALQTRDVRAFLAARRSEGVGSRSLSRSLSALRMFYKFLERRGYGKNDAIRGVSLPKLPHSVPKPLTAPKATALIEGADIASPDAPEWVLARDTAVLALLYGSGLRISEALTLKRKDAPVKGRDMLRVTGKGGKTRVVPVLPIVREAVERYLKLCLLKLGSEDPLFVGVRGKQLSPRIIQLRIAGARAALGLAGDGDAACASPFLRHASLGRGRRSPRHPGAARPCESLDNARLYRGRSRPFAQGLRPRSSPRLRRLAPQRRPHPFAAPGAGQFGQRCRISAPDLLQY